jgi:hypothetical protein
MERPPRMLAPHDMLPGSAWRVARMPSVKRGQPAATMRFQAAQCALATGHAGLPFHQCQLEAMASDAHYRSCSWCASCS